MSSTEDLSVEDLLKALQKKGVNLSAKTLASAGVKASKKSNKLNIEKSLILYNVLLDVFACKGWQGLKAMFYRDSDGAINRTQITLSGSSFITYDELTLLIDAVEAYEQDIQKTTPSFHYTDYQFFTVLFTEIFFAHQSEIHRAMSSQLNEYKHLRLADIQAMVSMSNEELKSTIAELLSYEKTRTKGGEYSTTFDKRFNEFLELKKEGVQSWGTLLATAPSKKPFHITEKGLYLNQLNRLAYYMATGSGKTHLLHINILQAEKYLPEQDMYLLAPTDTLAKQHVEKLKLFRPSWTVGYVADTEDTSKKVSEAVLSMCKKTHNVKVMTVHQLNAGLSSRNNCFGKTNVVFADEGHKGTSSATGWRHDRNTLTGEKGFCFEYSATFSQSIKDNVSLLQDYGKAIIFDYPYRLFRQDGYGKMPAFYPREKMNSIAKLISGESKDKVEITLEERWPLFVESLLSFYEQKLFFQNKKSESSFQKHGFENPLMLMMACRVVNKDSKASNILEIISLFDRFCTNKNNESINALQQALSAPDRWVYLDCTQSSESLFSQLYDKVLHANKPATLEVMRLSSKELGLRIAGAVQYFGTVFVGDVNAIKLDTVDITVSNDKLTDSLIEPFFGPDANNPDVNIIVAARKLVEGWDTHRISTLGLFDLGKKEGSLIVQLFGRGVRLHGTNQNKLKRTGVYPLPEQFNIFGFDAGFLQEFIVQSELEDTVNQKSITVAIKISDGTDGTVDLITNKQLPKCLTAYEDSDLLLISPSSNMHTQIVNAVKRDFSQGQESIEVNIYPFINGKKLFQAIRCNTSWQRNLQICYADFDVILQQLTNKPIKLKSGISLPSFDIFHSIAKRILADYFSRCFKQGKKNYEFNSATLEPLERESKNLSFEYYTVSGESAVIARLESELVQSGAIPDSKFQDIEEVKTAFFEQDKFAIQVDGHLYNPLLTLLQKHDGITISPDRLEKSETIFLERFQQYTKVTSNLELSTLRNQKEIGFNSYYPDFVMWYENEGLTHIIFVDPKGITTGNVDDVADKLFFSFEIKKVEQRINKTASNIRLHSYILLNHKLEDYESNKVIKQVLEKRFADELTGGISSNLSSDDFIKTLRIFNAYSLADSDVIDQIIKDVGEDSLDDQRKQFSDYWMNLLPDKTKDSIKTFCTETKDSSVKELREKYNFDSSLETTDELLYAFILRDVMGSQSEYNEFYKNASTDRNKSDLKDGAREILELEAEGLIADFGMEIILGSLPYASLAWRVLKILRRNIKTEKDCE